MGSTVSAIIRIRNSTIDDIVAISVYDFDNFQFGATRPSKALNGTSIPSHGVLERTVDFSAFATSCSFTMKFLFRNHSEDIFRMNYKWIFGTGEPHFRHLTPTHLITLNKTGPRVLEIIVENTDSQKENQRAEELITEGCKLMKIGKYGQASVKFMEASQRANEQATIANARKQSRNLRTVRELVDGDKKAKTLNNQGLELLKSARIAEAIQRLEDALNFARSSETVALVEDNLAVARWNREAAELNAAEKYDEALRLATDSDLIESIKTNKVRSLSAEGADILKTVWLSDDEAIHQFSKAKFLFQEADSIEPNSDYWDSIATIDSKLEGHRHFNTALQLENRNMYEEALEFYKKAEIKFREGMDGGNGNFERGLELTRDALNRLEPAI